MALPPAEPSELQVGVRLTSSVCGQAGTLRKSSGIAFNQNGRFYVLALASHVLNGPNTCHQVEPRGGAKLPMTLQSWQWGKLALLEVGGRFDEALQTDLLSLRTYHTVQGSVVRFDEAAATWKIFAVAILSESSDRGSRPSMIETDINIDQSFVGWPVTIAQSILGMISDEYLEIKPGSSAELKFWRRAKPSLVTSPLLIRLDEMQAFVRQALSGTLKSDGIEVSLVHQLADRDVLTTGSLELSEDCPDSSVTTPGGSYPIGGVDPVGVGGGLLSKPGCFIRIKRAAAAGSMMSPLFDRKNWGSKVDELLRSADHVDVPYVFLRDPVFDYNDRRVLFSMRQFLGQLERSEFSPLTIAYAAGSVVPGLDPRLKEVRDLAKKSNAVLFDFYLQYMKTLDSYQLDVVRELYFVVEMATTEEWPEISQTQLDGLLDRTKHRLIWGMIENDFFFKNKVLYPDLVSLQNKLKAL